VFLPHFLHLNTASLAMMTFFVGRNLNHVSRLHGRVSNAGAAAPGSPVAFPLSVGLTAYDNEERLIRCPAQRPHRTQAEGLRPDGG
jgi:hypothetical protein